MYLNIILTLLFLAIAHVGITFSVMLAIMRKEGHQERTQYLENKQYPKDVNSEVLELHWSMLNEMKSMTEKQKEILAEIKRRSHDRLML